MIIEIKIPSPGESISEVELANWLVEDGDTVEKDQEIGEIESEKATLPLIAEQAGKIQLLASAGDTLKVGSVACKIDTSVKLLASPPAAGSTDATGHAEELTSNQQPVTSNQQPVTSNQQPVTSNQQPALRRSSGEPTSNIKITPVAKKIMEEEGLSVEDIINGLRKITSRDVKAVKEISSQPEIKIASSSASREEKRTPLSQLRKKISERLVAVKNETAMLTTFNEVDMSAVMELRKKYQDAFVEKHGVKLGFMSFFTKAATLALKSFPNVNSYLDKDEIVTPEFCDIGIAVQTDKGLMVPILRNTETMTLADIEKHILDIAGRARKNRISMDEMAGGTFTITNGGIFGSMLSTPILNPPQSAILGMHNIVDRPVAVNGKVEIRPVMYLALSYDHRVIDGRDSVGFLKTVKEYIENPTAMLLGNDNQEHLLLNI